MANDDHERQKPDNSQLLEELLVGRWEKDLRHMVANVLSARISSKVGVSDVIYSALNAFCNQQYDESDPWGYLVGIVRKKALKANRENLDAACRNARREIQESPDNSGPSLVDQLATCRPTAEDAVTCIDLLTEMRASLSAADGAVFDIMLSDATASEAATELGFSKDQYRKRVQDVRKKCRKFLDRQHD